MKNIFLSILLLLAGSFVYGQDTVKRTNNLTAQLLEKYSVLKSNKKLRQGEYYAVYKQTTIMAKGRYEAGKRVGLWNYFTRNGKLLQTFDYDKYQFNYRDTLSGRKAIQYNFPQSIFKTDTLSNPIVIGGFDYTIYPLILKKELNDAIRSDFPPEQKIDVKHIFTISPTGVLLKHEVVATGAGITKVYKLDDQDFDDGNRKFIPGMINHQPVVCQITTDAPMSYTTTQNFSGFPRPKEAANRDGFN